ncbi:MAG: efflux RND transporter periplasmic adaptor subunit [Hyphomicrobiaceae bacterium]
MGQRRIFKCLALATVIATVIAAGAVAQPAGSAANAAEKRVAAPVQAAAEPAPGWIVRQWNTVAGWFASGPERGRAPSAGGPGNAPPPQVTISRPITREVIEWDEYTGRFDAVDTIEVRARVAGFLNEVHFTDGQLVKKGDPLFSIDPRPFERALATANAELEQARTKVESAMKDVARGRPLVDRRVISEKVFDDRENLKREAEAAVNVAEAKVRTAELDLSFTKISAPLGGRIGRNLISVGNYVTGGGGGSASQTLLTTIVSQNPIQFYFDVSENNTIKYKRLATTGTSTVGVPGAAIEIALPDDKGFPHVGKLDFNDNRLDATTGTLRMRAILDNAAGLLSPGMFGRARIAGSAPYNAILLPDDSVGTDQAAKYVTVVAEDGTASRKVVTLGPIIGGMRVVRTGLAQDDWVVIKGQQRARPGQKVAPKREPLQVSNAPADAAPTTTRQ